MTNQRVETVYAVEKIKKRWYESRLLWFGALSVILGFLLVALSEPLSSGGAGMFGALLVLVGIISTPVALLRLIFH